MCNCKCTGCKLKKMQNPLLNITEMMQDGALATPLPLLTDDALLSSEDVTTQHQLQALMGHNHVTAETGMLHKQKQKMMPSLSGNMFYVCLLLAIGVYGYMKWKTPVTV